MPTPVASPATVNVVSIDANIDPVSVSISTARAIRPTISHRQNWLAHLICGWPSPDPLVRLRKRSINYYLRRAAAPSANQRRKAKRKNTLPRPENVKDLHRCRWNVALSAVLLALSITFIACYCLMPALRVSLGSCEGLACSVSVVTLFVSVTVFACNAVEIWRIHRDAHEYATFVRALVDEKGHFKVEDKDDNEYAAYLKALKLDVLVILQREYYDWYMHGKPPVRQIPTGYELATFDAE